MKNLFIDANIWLSLFDFTNEKIEKFEVLKDMMKDEINLIIPEQVYYEVLRNRDGKIKNAWDKFTKFDFPIPTFCQSYPDYTSFHEKLKDLKRDHNSWKNKIEQDIRNHTLRADKLLSELFVAAGIRKVSPDITKLAEIRYRSGNPPGKNNSFGDAINWEFLLQVIPHEEDLHLISGDQDYRSKFDDESFNFFLHKEWNMKKNSIVHFYRTLDVFLQNHAQNSIIPEENQSGIDDKKREELEQRRKAIVDLAKTIEESSIEEKKNNAISLLQNSRSFANTHNAISLLSKYDSWTQEQIDAICEAAQMNDQIWLIINDEDVDDFYTSILKATKEETSSVIGLRKMLYGDYTEQLKDVIS